MTNTVLSLLPPILAIIMVILTKRVLLSLGAGIVAAAIIRADFQVLETISILFAAIVDLFYLDGSLNMWNISIILFLLFLGIITAFISLTGGSRAFAEWAMKKVRTRKGANLLTALLGVIIFIDDYFNALAVGQISRPLSDKYKVSRAKLAYLIDSTSAPICVIAPISSWGASIIAIIATILAAHQVTDYSAFSAFMQMVPMNLYVWATLLLVFLVALGNMDIGQMKKHEKRAEAEGILYDPNKQISGELKEDLPISNKGTAGDLIWPIIMLIIGTVGAMIWTGLLAVGGNPTLLSIFESTDVALSLLIGAAMGLAAVSISFARQAFVKKSIQFNMFGKAIWAGVKSMLPAVAILLFAWVIADLIGQIGTGAYLAGLVEHMNISIGLLPVLLFTVAGIMAFSTGTSWGSFGILLPIAGDIAASTDISILLPALSAVLAGAVFGDHASPISDTTILSATGAGCNHIDHVLTQLPYALISAGCAAVGFVVLGYTKSTSLSLAVSIFLIAIIAVIVKRSKTAD